MSCKFTNHIECTGGNCGKCGWNPAVSEKRKKKSRKDRADTYNLIDRLRDYRKNCFDVLAERSGVDEETLKIISMGSVPVMDQRDLKRIDEVLRRFEVGGGG